MRQSSKTMSEAIDISPAAKADEQWSQNNVIPIQRIVRVEKVHGGEVVCLLLKASTGTVG